MAQPESGAILAGKYCLVRQLGKGGMGAVWRAEHLALKSPVAIKLIDPEIAKKPEALNRFLREAQAAALLRSPHVVQILDYGVDEGVPYIAMEVLEGESLADRLEQSPRLPPAQVARVITHVARAVSRAHEAGIVHRDLKPDNVFLVNNDEDEVAKVLDFGVLKSTSPALDASDLTGTQSGALIGTPYYMSPEQAEGNRAIDPRADIWAMGVIAFECLTGHRPFTSEALGSIVLDICVRPLPIPSDLAEVPAGFDAWFARACARDPDQRFGTAKEAASELRGVCGEVGPETVRSVRLASISAESDAEGVQASLPLRKEAARSMIGLSTTNSRALVTPRETSRLRPLALVLAGLLLGAGLWIWLERPRRIEPPPATQSQATSALRSAAALAKPGEPTVSFVPDASLAPRGASSSSAPNRNSPRSNSPKAPGAPRKKVNLGI